MYDSSFNYNDCIHGIYQVLSLGISRMAKLILSKNPYTWQRQCSMKGHMKTTMCTRGTSIGGKLLNDKQTTVKRTALASIRYTYFEDWELAS